MSNYNLEIPGLFACGAPSMMELEKLIERAMQIRDENKGAIVAEQIAVIPPRIAQPKIASNACEEQWKEASGERRMRMTTAAGPNGQPSEKEQYGEDREACARARLLAMGVDPCEDGGEATGESEGVTWQGNIDPGVVPE